MRKRNCHIDGSRDAEKRGFLEEDLPAIEEKPLRRAGVEAIDLRIESVGRNVGGAVAIEVAVCPCAGAHLDVGVRREDDRVLFEMNCPSFHVDLRLFGEGSSRNSSLA